MKNLLENMTKIEKIHMKSFRDRNIIKNLSKCYGTYFQDGVSSTLQFIFFSRFGTEIVFPKLHDFSIKNRYGAEKTTYISYETGKNYVNAQQQRKLAMPTKATNRKIKVH